MKVYQLIHIIIIAVVFTSCESILLEQDISNEQPEILAPIGGSKVSQTTVDFRWSAVEGANAYHLQVVSPTFENAGQIIFDEIIEEGLLFSEEFPLGKYEWRLYAINNEYQTEYVSARFEVVANDDFSSNRVRLISPEEDFITNKIQVSLEWNSVEEATNYRIQILKDGQKLKEEITSETEVQMDFSDDGAFTWKVRAENETQNTFYTKRQLVIDTTAPAPIILKLPENEMVLNNAEINFEWEKEDSSSVEIDSLYIYKDADLDNLVIKERVEDSFSTTLEEESTYFWFMRAFDEAGNQSERSTIFSFSID